eukprot:1158562-Pelagomonas_calceolata.AAC.9
MNAQRHVPEGVKQVHSSKVAQNCVPHQLNPLTAVALVGGGSGERREHIPKWWKGSLSNCNMNWTTGALADT